MVLDDGVSEHSRRFLNPDINPENGEYYKDFGGSHSSQTDIQQDLKLEEIVQQVAGVIYTGPFLEETKDQETARLALEKFTYPKKIAKALINNYDRKIENEPKLESRGVVVVYNPRTISEKCLKEADAVYQCLAGLQSKYQNNIKNLYESTGYGKIKRGNLKTENIIHDSLRRFKEVYTDLLLGATREELLDLGIEDEIRGRDGETTLEIPIRLLERFEIISSLLEYTFNVREEKKEFLGIKKLESDPVNIDRPTSFKYKLFNRFTLAKHIADILNNDREKKIETSGLDKVIEEIENRSGELTIGFNNCFKSNTANEIKNFSIYNDGTINGRKLEFSDVIASYKHSSDKQMHQLAFNLKNLNGQTGTIGIAIMVDCFGLSIKIKNSREDIFSNKYITLDGFTAADWFSDLKIENGDNIYEIVADTVINYSLKRKRKLFVNCSHMDSNKLNEVQQSNNNLIRLLAKREGYTYNLGTLMGEFDKLEIGNRIFTHYMKKEPDEELGDNIQYLHAWKEYKEIVPDLIERLSELEELNRRNGFVTFDRSRILTDFNRYNIFNQLLAEELYELVINPISNRRDIIENEGIRKPLPRAWNECSGLVKGFEIKKGLKRSRDSRKNSFVKKSLLVVLPVITSGIIIRGHMTEKVNGEIIGKEEVKVIDIDYIRDKHNRNLDNTAREIGNPKIRGYREGGYSNSYIPKEGLSDISYKMPSLEDMLDPEIEIKGEIPLIGKPRLIVGGIEFKLNDEDDLRNLINKIVTLRYEMDLRSGRSLQLMQLNLKKHLGRLMN